MGEKERAVIVEVLTEKITPEGVGDLKYGRPMSEVALSQNDSTATAYAISIRFGINIPGIDIPGKTGEFRLPIRISAIGNSEVGSDYCSSTGHLEHKWNPDSKLTYFSINIINRDAKDWVNPLLNELVDGYKKCGYKEILREKNNIKNAVVLSKGSFNLFIEDNGENEIIILCGYNLINTQIYRDYRQVFSSSKTGMSII